MIELLLIAITWYVTKLYYTKSFSFDIEQSDLIQAICSNCSRLVYVSPDNMRNPYYCVSCK